MEESGVLKEKKSVETKVGKDGNSYVSQQFIVEIPDEKYPRTICFKGKGKVIEKLGGAKVGDSLRVLFNLSSREYKGNWYTEATAWGLDVGSGGGRSTSSTNTDSDTPF